jgi:CheY-like chemotaxis protein
MMNYATGAANNLSPSVKEAPQLPGTRLLKLPFPSPLSLPPEPHPFSRQAAAPKTRILVAEDDPVSRELICARLVRWGYEVIVTENGEKAMMALRKTDAPSLAILDWMMPGMSGLEICRRVREVDRVLYIIMLTACGSKASVVEGLGAGADDYLIKPFDSDELHARILVGERVMALQSALSARVRELGAPMPAAAGGTSLW